MSCANCNGIEKHAPWCRFGNGVDGGNAEDDAPCLVCGETTALDDDGEEFCPNPDCASYGGEKASARVIAVLVNACLGALNIEGSALRGAEPGLDVPVHFVRIREALKIAEQVTPDAFKAGMA